MKVKRRLPYIIVIIFLIAYLAFLTLSSSSFGADIVDDVMGLTGHAKVRFSAGRFPADTTDLTVVLQDGETALLSGFDHLRSADFRGSTCYDEIIRWADANPNIDVHYSVAFPNGTSVDSNATSANLQGLTHETAPQAAALLKYLPNLNSIDLGRSADSPSPLSSEDIAAIRAAAPDASLNYSMTFLGKDFPIDSEKIDLSGLSSAQVPEIISSLRNMPNLKVIEMGKSGNSDLSLNDVTEIAYAFPDATVNYAFDLGGKAISLSDESVDLSAINKSSLDSILEILPCMTKLTYAKLGGTENGLEWSDIDKLYEAAPNCVFDYTVDIWGKQISLASEKLDFNHIQMADEGASVKQLLPYMRNCKMLDMDSCMVSNEAMASIRDAFPEIEVVWRVNFGDNYSVRTNVTKILASKPSKGGALYDSAADQLKYCTKVRYLDLGHNDSLSDFSFVRNMPDLEIVVISMCAISDLTPFSSCSHLKYIEAGNTHIGDLSPLASCKELKHLNVGTNSAVKDISCIYDLDLKRLWLGVGDPVPADQVAKYRELHPDCEVNTTCMTGNEATPDGRGNEGYNGEGWKYWQQATAEDWARDPMNLPQRPLGYWKVAYKAFQYNLGEAAYAFSWNDPMYNEHDDSVEPINVTIIDTSFFSEKWVPDVNNYIPDVLTDPPGNPIN